MTWILADNLSRSVEMPLHFSPFQALQVRDRNSALCGSQNSQMSIRPTCLRLSLCISMQFPFHYLWLFYPRQKKARAYTSTPIPIVTNLTSPVYAQRAPLTEHIYTQVCVRALLDIHVCTIVMGFLVSWGESVRGESLSMPLRIEWETRLPLSVNKQGQEAVISYESMTVCVRGHYI